MACGMVNPCPVYACAAWVQRLLAPYAGAPLRPAGWTTPGRVGRSPFAAVPGSGRSARSHARPAAARRSISVGVRLVAARPWVRSFLQYAYTYIAYRHEVWSF